MNTYLFLKGKLLFFALLCYIPLYSQTNCPNRAIHFGPNPLSSTTNNFIKLSLSTLEDNSNFTIEAWFSSEAIAECSEERDARSLFSLGANDTTSVSQFLVRECGGQLNVSWLDSIGHRFSTDFGPLNIRDGWHHIAVARDSHQVQFFLDGNSVLDTIAPTYLTVDYFMVGARNDATTNRDFWEGKIDEIRVWSDIRTVQQIYQNRSCRLLGSEPELQVYWPLDDGIPNGNNTSIHSVLDASGNGQNGALIGFTLNDSTSNFICSDYNIADFKIQRNPQDTIVLSEMYLGDSPFFNLNLPSTLSPLRTGSKVIWQYTDDGINWIDNDPATFSDPVGTVLSSPMILTDCTTNKHGFVNRQFREL